MPSKEAKSRLSGNEVVEIDGFAIAYRAHLEGPSGGHSIHTIQLSPTLIQELDIPHDLHGPILEIIDRYERRRWGLPEREDANGAGRWLRKVLPVKEEEIPF